MNDVVRVSPSILSADFLRLGEELASIHNADWVHFDVMDGDFVPNVSFGQDILRAVKRGTDLPVDVHLMVSNPDETFARYLDAGADILTFHWEAATHPHRIVSAIRDRGAKAGVAINPGTPVSSLDAIIDYLDLVLVMSVNPGFGGQKFIEGTYRQLDLLQKLCQEHGVAPIVEVDGGVGTGNAGKLAAHGVGALVAGSAVFKAPDHAQAVENIRKAALLGLEKRA